RHALLVHQMVECRIERTTITGTDGSGQGQQGRAGNRRGCFQWCGEAARGDKTKSGSGEEVAFMYGESPVDGWGLTRLIVSGQTACGETDRSCVTSARFQNPWSVNYPAQR
ncbi:MAG: hypothetical protein ACI802_003870, partial [Candidatus Paceibacteria bacterium]